MKLTFDVINVFYKKGLWNALQVETAYTKGVITKEEKDKILEKNN